MDEYQLTCTDCSFSTVEDGGIDAVFDAIEAHRAAFATDPSDHFVEFELLGHP